MSLANRELDELAELCDVLLDGKLTDQQKSRLDELLVASEEARQFYVRVLGLSASLFEYAAELQFPTQTVPSASMPVGRKRQLWWALAALTTAAAIVVAIVLHGSNDASGEADAEEFAAQITGLQDCQWADAKPGLELGDQLQPGQQLELASGMAEITFDCGAQVTLEGPAKLNLNSAWEATLHRGKLRAEVPAEAVGFGIQSATVDVVDLGTEFGMTVDAQGATDVCVLQGAVEATPRDTASAQPTKFVLKQHKARRFNHTGSEEIENTANLLSQFTKPTKLQRLAKTAKHVHWSFDEADGRKAQADGSWPSSKDLGALIETSSEVDQAEPRIGGRWRGALRFDGHLHAHASVPGFSDRTPHTIAFWVRIPSEATLGDTGPIFAWFTKAQDSAHVQPVQIGWNTNRAQGPLGALRTDIGRIDAIGTTNLRDGQWHHVAVAVLPHNSGKQRWRVKQYVDGRLEQGTAKTAKKGRSDMLEESADDIVWLGREAGASQVNPKKFRGELDELFIVDRALSPQQIARLFRENELTSLETAKGK
jgi:ferric-dicitrate binding protein FerR (iron transport regulator)